PFLAAFGFGLKKLPDGRTNLVDAAVAEPIDTGLVAPDILGIGAVTRTVDADLGMRVRKSGRTTGLTEGKITALDTVVEVDYDGKTAIFRQQFVSDIVSMGGDSGSLIVDDAGRAVGLLFAGSATTTLLNPIKAVAHFLDLALT
ncbi:MAG: S1 family peptidase, partial [Thermoplasmata archaeon]|nr:S1 family peptidase [Thermoplasmata archaeon]